jgi:N-acylglucosamine 2-epimerase
MSTPPSVSAVIAWRDRVREDLWARTLPFWLFHSIDQEDGGYFNCLDINGAVYDTTKHVWLQGRQAWLFARLANEFSDAEIAAFFARYPPTIPREGVVGKTGAVVPPVSLNRSSLVEAARRGCHFLLKHAVRREDGHVYFALTRDGRPFAMQRKPFSATFLIMALSETARAADEPALKTAALDLFARTLGWIREPGSLGKLALAGSPDLQPLNVPMIILNVISELRRGGVDAAQEAIFAAEESKCIASILAHVDTSKGGVVRASVSVLLGETSGERRRRGAGGLHASLRGATVPSATCVLDRCSRTSVLTERPTTAARTDG